MNFLKGNCEHIVEIETRPFFPLGKSLSFPPPQSTPPALPPSLSLIFPFFLPWHDFQAGRAPKKLAFWPYFADFLKIFN